MPTPELQEGDKLVICGDCASEFVWTKGEQEFYAERGFQPPKRCQTCRRNRKEQRRADRENTPDGVSRHRGS